MGLTLAATCAAEIPSFYVQGALLRAVRALHERRLVYCDMKCEQLVGHPDGKGGYRMMLVDLGGGECLCVSVCMCVSCVCVCACVFAYVHI